MSHTDDIHRITEGLRAAAEAVAPFTPGAVAFETKDERGDPLTAADLAADRVLREILPRDGEGWLSEESADDRSRLVCRRVWVVDPIDGTLEGATVLASRSETSRGEWEPFAHAPFAVKPCGSVAYKMALVAAGQVDMTWTLVPKSEWDVAAGVALIAAGGGRVTLRDGTVPTFNQETPLFPNFVAAGKDRVTQLVEEWL